LSNAQNSGGDGSKDYKSLDYILSGLVLLIAAVGSSITGKKTSEQNGNNANRQIADWTRVVGKWTRVLAVIGAVVGGLTVMVLGLQTCILSNQLAEMRAGQRPWINFVADPASPFHYDENGNAILITQVSMKNIGKLPAQYVAIRGKMFPWIEPDRPIQERNALCKELRDRRLIPANTGFVMMPDDVSKPLAAVAMAASDVTKWKNVQGAVPVIVACIDYVFFSDLSHHHLGLIMEVDKKGTDPKRPIAAIRPEDGEIPQNSILLNMNAALPWDID
jgi:hypothetical protein